MYRKYACFFIFFFVIRLCYSQSFPANSLFYELRNISVEGYSKYIYFANVLPNSIILDLEIKDKGTITYCIFPYYNDTFYVKKFFVRTLKSNDTASSVLYDITPYKIVLVTNLEQKVFFEEFIALCMSHPEFSSGPRTDISDPEYWRYNITNKKIEHFFGYKKNLAKISFSKRMKLRQERQKMQKLKKILNSFEFVSLK